MLVEKGTPADQIVLIAHGKVSKIGTGNYGDGVELAVFAMRPLHLPGYHRIRDLWDFTMKAVTRCTALVLTQRAFEEVAASSESLQAHIEEFKARPPKAQDTHGQAAIALAAIQANPCCPRPLSITRPLRASTVQPGADGAACAYPRCRSQQRANEPDRTTAQIDCA